MIAAPQYDRFDLEAEFGSRAGGFQRGSRAVRPFNRVKQRFGRHLNWAIAGTCIASCFPDCAGQEKIR